MTQMKPDAEAIAGTDTPRCYISKVDAGFIIASHSEGEFVPLAVAVEIEQYSLRTAANLATATARMAELEALCDEWQAKFKLSEREQGAILEELMKQKFRADDADAYEKDNIRLRAENTQLKAKL